MYANVVVLTYQSPETDSYTYLVPKELEKQIKAGQLVSVPFGKRNPLGVVISLSSQLSTLNFQIKEISSIALNQPILLPYQIELLKWLSFYYHAPMINCLETMLPAIPKKILRVTGAGDPRRAPATNAIKSVSTLQSVSEDVGRGWRLAGPAINQTLVLVPTINHLPQTLALYPSAKNYALYHNELKMSEKFSAWQKILSGQVDFIFGSRLTIFTPCPNLKKIIIFDEHETAYKDDQSPYFDTLTVAEKICQLTAAKLEIVDSSPKITTYFNYPDKIKITNPPAGGLTKIISMENEKLSGNRSATSTYLEEALKRNRGSTLLFLNRKIESGNLFCKNCKHQEFLNRQVSVCPNCQSPDIWFNSLNIFTLASEVRKIVPEARVRLIAEGLSQQPNSPTAQQPNIDIATASVFYSLQTKKYDLVANVRTDSTLNVADFASGEKTYFQVCNLKKLATKLLVLQTYNPDHPVITAAASGTYQKFFDYETSQRKLLSYPPYSLLVKLTLRGKPSKELETKAEKLTVDLKNLLTINHLPVKASATSGLPLTVLGPYRPIFQTQQAKYNIILKVPTGSYSLANRQNAVKNLSKYFEIVPKDWRVIVEPGALN